MQNKIAQIIVALIVIVYIVSPFDFPGPVDDIIVTFIGTLIEYRISHKKEKDNDNKD